MANILLFDVFPDVYSIVLMLGEQKGFTVSQANIILTK